jgi:hypothetical protein
MSLNYGIINNAAKKMIEMIIREFHSQHPFQLGGTALHKMNINAY